MTTVLVAHSRRVIRETFAACLRGEGNARIIKATNGLDVLGIIGSRQLDAVIVSADFPDVDTGDLLGWIRANGPTRDLPVLVIDKPGNRHYRHAWNDAGATGVLTVPFAVDALRSRVRDAIEARMDGALRSSKAVNGSPRGNLRLS